MRVGGRDAKVPALAGLMCFAGAALAACGGSRSSAPDAGTGGSGASIDAPFDLVLHEAAPEHDYPEAGPPDALGTPIFLGFEHRWLWTPIAGALCRDGSSTGIAVNASHTSPNVVVFLDQGGACFQEFTCNFNSSAYDATSLANGVGVGAAIFNRTDPDNPVRDWSFIFVPYCTGDVHSGSRSDVTITNVPGTQQFVGYRNLDAILARVVPAFASAEQVLLVGSSAGGFGALLNADHVARWFAPIPVTALSDSGPPMPNAVAAPCLEQLWTDDWGFADGVLADCGIDCPSSSDYMFDEVMHFGRRFPTYRSGLISSTQDSVISYFLSFGNNDCAGGGTIDPGTYQSGLLAFRDQVHAQHSPFGTYFIGNDARHAWLLAADQYAVSVGGISLKSWLADLLAGQISDVGP